MSESTQSILTGDAARAEALARALDEVIRRRHQSEQLTDEQVIAQHPDLMPELAQRLRQLSLVQKARAAGDETEPLAPSTPGARDFGRFPTIPDYELVAQLGGGGQAIVYKAKYRQYITRAVKVFRNFSDEESVRHTARILDNLQDESRIVKIQDIGRTDDGKLFIATNFIDGKTLDAFLDEELRDPAVPAQTVLTLFHKITEIVNFAHIRGIIHGDLKPANIIVDERPEPHLLDFDLARTGASHAIDSRFIGSLPWAAPEQAAGQQNRIDTRTDVYSLGVVLYYMVTGGRFPYVHLDNMAQMLREISEAKVVPPNQRLDQPRHSSESRQLRPPEIPINKDIEWIVLKALGRRRDDRFRNAGELGDAIKKYLRGEPVRPADAVHRSPPDSRSAGGAVDSPTERQSAGPEQRLGGRIRGALRTASWRVTSRRFVVISAIILATTALNVGIYQILLYKQIREIRSELRQSHQLPATTRRASYESDQ